MTAPTMASPAGRRAAFQRPRSVEPEIRTEIEEFLALDSELLDDRRYHEWVQLVTETFTYQVPTPRTPDSPFKPHYDDRVLLIDESRWSLATQWFRRFDEDIYEMAWGENPPIRFRHFVTNVRARNGALPDSYEVRSNVSVVATRQSDAPKYLTGERTDTLVRQGDVLMLQHRWVVLDQVLIDFPQLRVML